MLANCCSRVRVAELPTPVDLLRRLTVQLQGPQIFVKRDDLTGLATGGNKTRKLEFLVAEALAQDSDTLVTCGAAQSNHARQTAAAAAQFGLHCTIVLRADEPPHLRGNLLLDKILGANIVWAGSNDIDEKMQQVVAALSNEGRNPYVIPYGASNCIGVVGYVAGMEELLLQCKQNGYSFDHIVVASSSGGTQAGMLVAARAYGFEGRVVGISIDLHGDELREKVASLATSTARRLKLPLDFDSKEVIVNDDYLGKGYGVIGSLERNAICTLASNEGLLLDPVYTGRAFGGLLDLIGKGEFSSQDKVLFWHTGGTTGLFACDDIL